jgi:hypothetical protein
MRTNCKAKVFISYVWLDEKDKNGNPAVLKNGKVPRIPDERAFNLAERLREFGFDSGLDVSFKDAHDKYGFLPTVRSPRRQPGPMDHLGRGTNQRCRLRASALHA